MYLHASEEESPWKVSVCFRLPVCHNVELHQHEIFEEVIIIVLRSHAKIGSQVQDNRREDVKVQQFDA